jgi:hypothetical protein
MLALKAKLFKTLIKVASLLKKDNIAKKFSFIST